MIDETLWRGHKAESAARNQTEELEVLTQRVLTLCVLSLSGTALQATNFNIRMLLFDGTEKTGHFSTLGSCTPICGTADLTDLFIPPLVGFPASIPAHGFTLDSIRSFSFASETNTLVASLHGTIDGLTLTGDPPTFPRMPFRFDGNVRYDWAVSSIATGLDYGTVVGAYGITVANPEPRWLLPVGVALLLTVRRAGSR